MITNYQQLLSYRAKRLTQLALLILLMLPSFMGVAQNSDIAGIDPNPSKSAWAKVAPSTSIRKSSTKPVTVDIPACAKVQTPEVVSVSSSAAVLRWVHSGDMTKTDYIVAWKNTRTNEVKDARVSATLNIDHWLKFEMLDLEPEQTYDITITANCNFSYSPDYDDNWVESIPVNLTLTTPLCGITSSSFEVTTDYSHIGILFNKFTKTNDDDEIFYETQLLDWNTGNVIETNTVEAGANESVTSFPSNFSCTNYIVSTRPKCRARNENAYSYGAWVTKQVKTLCCGELAWEGTPNVTQDEITVRWNSQTTNPDQKIKAELYQGTTLVRSTWLDRNVTTHTFSNLTTNTKYTAKISMACRCQHQSGSLIDFTCATTGTPITLDATTIDPCATIKNVAVNNVTSSQLSVGVQVLPSSAERRIKVIVSGNIIKEKTLILAPYAATNYTIDFDGLAGNTDYSVSVSLACCVPGSNCNQVLTSPGQPIVVATKTKPVVCTAPVDATVTNIYSNSIVVGWTHNIDVTDKRYHIYLYRGITLEKDSIILSDDPTSGSTITHTFYGLSPSVDYRIKVQSDCCQSQDTYCNNWLLGEEKTLLAKTKVYAPPICTTSPTVFTFVAGISDVSINWSGGTAAPLSATGRRFLVEYGNPKALYVIDAANNNVIRGLKSNTNYILTVTEVFDGQHNTYGEACNASNLAVLTALSPIACDAIFAANGIQGPVCSNEANLLFEIQRDPTLNANGFRIHYREVTSFIKQTNSTYVTDCATLEGPSLIPNNPATDWQWRDVASTDKLNLLGLKPCGTYEIKIESFKREANGKLSSCGFKTFDKYFNTKSAGSDQSLEDLDEDGIPDICDNEVTPKKVPEKASPNLKDLLCGDKPERQSYAGLPEYTLGNEQDIWHINDFPFEVTKITEHGSGSNRYSGNGIISLPFQGLSKLKISFNNITVVEVAGKHVVSSGKILGTQEGQSVQTVIESINTDQLTKGHL
jgi:hypothetical protein